MATPASLIPPDESASLVSGVLRQTQNRLTRVSLLASACVLLAATGLFVLGFVVADHFLDGGVPPRVRAAVLALYLIGVAAAVVVMIGLPAARRISNLYAARLLERAHPTFHNSLVNALQLEKHRELPGSIRSALLARAAVDAAHADVRRAVVSDRLRRAGIVLGAAAALFLGYVVFAPKPVLPSVLRAFGADIPAPTRTVVVDMEPADGASVIVGRPVTFTARLAGRIPADVYVHFSPDNGVTLLSGQRLTLSPASPADPPGRARIWQGTKAGQDVQQDMYWRLTAGDAASPWRRLVVRALPDVVDLRVTCVYPLYTGLASRTTASGQSADVDALIGTQVTVEAATNVPVRDPVLVIAPGADPADETRLSMRHVDLDATRIVGQFTVMQDGQYYLRFFDREGEPNQDPIRHTIRARPDRPPTITLIRPAADLELRPDEALEIHARVEDDYGVSRAAIEYKRGAQAAWVSLPLPTGPDASPTTRPAAARSLLETAVPLVRFGAVPGDVIEWHLAAWDNRVDLDGRLSPQKGVGPTRRILVPVPESLAKAEPPPEANIPAPATRPIDTELAENTRKDRADQARDAHDRSATASQPADARKAAPADAPTTRESCDLDNEAIAQAKTPEQDAVERFIREHQAELTKLREHLAKEAERQAEGKSEKAAAPSPADDTAQKTPPDEPRGESAEKPSSNAKDAAPPAGKDAARDAAEDTPKPAPDGDSKAQPVNPKTEQTPPQPERDKPEAGDTAAQAGADKSSVEPANAQDSAAGGKKAEEAGAANSPSDGENKAQAGAPKTAQGTAQPDRGGPKAGETAPKADASQSAVRAGGGQAAAEPAKAQDSATGAKKPAATDTPEASPGGEMAERAEAQVRAQQAGDAAGKQEGAPQGGREQAGQKSDAAGKPGSDGQAEPAKAQADAGGQGQAKASSGTGTEGQKAAGGEQQNGDGQKPARKLSEGPTAAAPAKTDNVSPGTPGSGLGTPVGDEGGHQGQSSTFKPPSASDAQQAGKGDSQGQQAKADAPEEGDEPGRGKGKGLGKEQGEAQGKSQGQGQGRGEDEGQGQGQGQAKGEGAGQGKGQGEGEGQGQAQQGQGQGQGEGKGEARAETEGRSGGQGKREAVAEGEGQGKGQGEGKGDDEGQGQGKEQGRAEGQGEAQGKGQGQGQGKGEGEANGKGQSEGQGKGQGQGEGQGQGAGQGQGQGKGQGQGEGKGAGQGQGQGKGEGQGQGQGQGQGDGQGQGQGKGEGQGKGQGQGQGSAEGKGSGSGSHPGYGPGGGPSAKSNQPDDSAAAPNPQPPGSPERGKRLETIGDVLPVIDALEERLRKRQVDPSLLDDLGWDETYANDFVRQFRRAERQAAEPSDSSAGPTDRFETTTRPSVAVERSDGSGADAAMLSARNVRAPDRTNQLFEVGRQRISDEYRDYLKAYYESIARDRPATRPAK